MLKGPTEVGSWLREASDGYKGAGVERRDEVEGILCFPACVGNFIGARGIEGPPFSLSAHRFLSAPLSYNSCPSPCLSPWLQLT